MVLCSGVFFATSENARADFSERFRIFYQYSVLYRFANESDNKALPVYDFPWLPAEFPDKSTNTDSDTKRGFTLKNDSNYIMFSYYKMSSVSKLVLYTAGYSHEEVYINGMKGDFYTQKHGSESELVWFDESAAICFLIYSDLDRDALIRTAESIQAVG